MITIIEDDEQNSDQAVSIPAFRARKNKTGCNASGLRNLCFLLLWTSVVSLLAFNYFNYQQQQQQKTVLTEEVQNLQALKQSFERTIQQAKAQRVNHKDEEAQIHSQIIEMTKQNLQAKNTEKPKAGRVPLIILPSLNQKKQGIEEVLYDEQTRKNRVAFYNDRVKFIDSNQHLPSRSLTKHNLILTLEQREAAQTEFDVEWQRIEQKFGLSKITDELPMCLIVPGYNNNANFRIESNLNSIFTQNYSNYKVVIINDASTDGSGDTYRRYFEFYGIDPAHYTYIENTVRVTAVENIYIASTKHCGKDDIVVTIDADDELIGRNALKVFNWGYQTKKLGVLYSNFYRQNVEWGAGFTQQYTEEEKRNNLYRDVKMKFSHLRSYRNELFLRLNPEDLKDENGKFYKLIYDQAIFFPLMEMSCGRVTKIEGEYHLLYTMGTGLNDYARSSDGVGARNEKRIRQGKKYSCVKQFDEKMKLLP